jgi:hypothetical protein
MLSICSFVEFTWWNSYYAASTFQDSSFNITWHKLNPGDKGVILGIIPSDTIISEIKYSVLFISVPGIPLAVYNSMLTLA